MNRQNSHEMVDHSNERTLRRPPRSRLGSIGMAAYQQQDPDPLRLHATLLAALGCSVRLWAFHGDRFDRLRTRLLP